MATTHPIEDDDMDTNMDATATGAPAAKRPRRTQGRIGTIVIMAVTAVVILGVVYAVNRPKADGGGLTSVVLAGGATGPAPIVGKQAPDITGETVDGRKVSLSSFKGRPVWVTFGASWCQPCRAENPDIQDAYARHKANGLVVLAVFMNEDAGTVRGYAKRVGLAYEKVADPNARIASSYRILGIPSHFFVDSSGVLRSLKTGSLDPSAMDTALTGIGA
jgi:cytochrome c biogenesis protein CcmG/thiol:disulfide interchange protein DsbE